MGEPELEQEAGMVQRPCVGGQRQWLHCVALHVGEKTGGQHQLWPTRAAGVAAALAVYADCDVSCVPWRAVLCYAVQVKHF